MFKVRSIKMIVFLACIMRFALAATLDLALSGKDLLVQAKTGTGKRRH